MQRRGMRGSGSQDYNLRTQDYDQPTVASFSTILRVAIVHEYINEVTGIGHFWLLRNLLVVRARSFQYLVHSQ